MKHWILIIFILAACVSCSDQATDEVPECFYQSNFLVDTGDTVHDILLFYKYVDPMRIENYILETLHFPLVKTDAVLWGGPCENTRDWLIKLSDDFESHEISRKEYLDYFETAYGGYIISGEQ